MPNFAKRLESVSPKRLLMLDSASQTDGESYILSPLTMTEREKELQNKIKRLERVVTTQEDLLTKIYDTTASTSLLIEEEQTEIQPIKEFNTNQSNSMNSPLTNGLALLSSAVINATKSVQNLSSPLPETYKYRIIAEGTENNAEEPIEIQLADDDGALNLNSSADSGRLEICLAPREITQRLTECKTMPTLDRMTTNNLLIVAPTEQQHSFNNCKLPKSASSGYVSEPLRNIAQKAPTKKRCRRSNNSPKPLKMQSGNINKFAAQNTTGTDAENKLTVLGPNNTFVPTKIFNSIQWASPSAATRKLLVAVFDRKVLATHSLTGKASPAFKDCGKPVKAMLDPLAVADIIHAVKINSNISEKQIRTFITTKCSDETKEMKKKKEEKEN